MEHPPTDPYDDEDETLLGDPDELDHLPIEQQLDYELQSELDDDEDI